VKRQCPSCQKEYETEHRYCPYCGVAGTVALVGSATEPVPGPQEQSPRQEAPRVEENDLRSEASASAKPVVPLAGHGNESDAGASEDAEGQKSAAPPPPPGSDEQSRQPRPRAVRAKGLVSYRSVRALAVANIVSNALMLSAVIALAYMYINSTERLQEKAQQQVAQLTRDAAEQRTASEQAHREELRATAERHATDAANMVQTMNDRFDALDKKLDVYDKRWLTSAMSQLVLRASGSVQKNLSSFYQKLNDPNVRRKELIRDANRLLPTIPDKQMRKEFKEKVIDVLTQQVQATE